MQKDVEVRFLNEQDITVIQEMYYNTDMKFHINFEPNEIADNEYYIGVFKGKTLVGVCTIGGTDGTEFDFDKKSCMLSDVYVVPDFRCNGYGSLLVDEAIKLAEKNYGADANVYISLLESNLAEWYKPLGFEVYDIDDVGVNSMNRPINRSRGLELTNKHQPQTEYEN